MVARVYSKAAASNYSRSMGCIAQPDRDPNQERARLMIKHYHAPYILQHYRPHFSLLSAVQENEKEQIFKKIEQFYDQYNLESRIRIDSIAVMQRTDSNSPWRIFKEYQLRGVSP